MNEMQAKALPFMIMTMFNLLILFYCFFKYGGPYIMKQAEMLQNRQQMKCEAEYNQRDY